MIWNELDMVKMKKHEFYEELPDSADDNEIERLSKEFFKVYNIDIPREYVEFLRQCNGVEFNGCIIYGSNNIIEKQLDAVNMNLGKILDAVLMMDVQTESQIEMKMKMMDRIDLFLNTISTTMIKLL